MLVFFFFFLDICRYRYQEQINFILKKGEIILFKFFFILGLIGKLLCNIQHEELFSKRVCF